MPSLLVVIPLGEIVLLVGDICSIVGRFGGGQNSPVDSSSVESRGANLFWP